MALTDTGERVDTLSATNAKAHDHDGNIVVVSASHEVIQDFGWSAIFDAATLKFDAGQAEPNNTPPLVRITTADCNNA
jgi:hypothetical protein